MTKYRSKKKTLNGVTFDSKAEADYYLYLLNLKRAGKVVEIELQPVIELQPKFRLNGKMVRAITYTPDFRVKYADGAEVLIDIKGISTQQGELKRKIYQYKIEQLGGVPLKWVAASKKYSKTGWIDWFELKGLRRMRRAEQGEKK